MKRFDSLGKHASDDLRENQSTLHIENDLSWVNCLNPVTAYLMERNTSSLHYPPSVGRGF